MHIQYRIYRCPLCRLPDGITWAIKKIELNVYNCRELKTHNPISTVKRATSRLLEDVKQIQTYQKKL